MRIYNAVALRANNALAGDHFLLLDPCVLKDKRSWFWREHLTELPEVIGISKMVMADAIDLDDRRLRALEEIAHIRDSLNSYIVFTEEMENNVVKKLQRFSESERDLTLTDALRMKVVKKIEKYEKDRSLATAFKEMFQT